MPEKKLSGLFLEIFIVAFVLVFLAILAMPGIARMMSGDMFDGQVSEIRDSEITLSANETGISGMPNIDDMNVGLFP
jgi:hypothetical protein